MAKKNFSDRKSKKTKKPYNFHIEPKINMNTITVDDLDEEQKKNKPS